MARFQAPLRLGNGAGPLAILTTVTMQRSEPRFWESVADDVLYTSGSDPKVWIETNGEFAWSKQREILDSIVANRYTAVHSAHDLGKSFIASRIIAWWIDSHPIGEAFVVSTAPSAAQVSAIMWREVAKIHRAADLAGKINRAGYPQWYVGPELVGYGRKPADYEQSAFQGIHAKYVLVVIDEACGVPRHLYDAIDSLVTNANCRVLAIGNPDDPASHFASICKPGSGWNVIHLDGLRSPNITYERVVGDDPEFPKMPLLAALMEAEHIPYSTEQVPDELREYLIDELWIEERIHRWAGVSLEQLGVLSREQATEMLLARTNGSALFTAKVRGIFPDAASEGVIPLGWITQAVARWHDMNDWLRERARRTGRNDPPPGVRITGVDVARTGTDQTCLALRHGDYVRAVERMRLTDTMEVATHVAAHLHEPKSTAVIDVIGIGSGVYDRVRQMKAAAEVKGTPIPFNASKQAQRKDRLGQFSMFNDRAAAWWNLREKLDPAFGSQVALPDDEELIEELCAPKYQLYANGRLKVEAKEDIKRRIGRSTDSADAVIQAFWIDGPGAVLDGIPYADVGAVQPRDSIYNYEGYDPFTDEDMSVGLGSSTMTGHSSVRPHEPRFGRHGDRPDDLSSEDGW